MPTRQQITDEHLALAAHHDAEAARHLGEGEDELAEWHVRAADAHRRAAEYPWDDKLSGKAFRAAAMAEEKSSAAGRKR